jgi:hypothetical protein
MLKQQAYPGSVHWKKNQRGFMSFGLVQLGQAASRWRLPLH